MLSPCHRARFRFEFINVDAVIIYLSGFAIFMIAFANTFHPMLSFLFCLPYMTLN